MKTRVQKWGHSLAVRIPKPYATEVGLADNTPVELTLQEGKLVLEPLAKPALKLEDLLKGVRKANLHREIDTGPAQGHEAW
jgi:antitoxin MazE